jgi:hypothetical protein
MKGTIRAEWPWAVALYRHFENFSLNALFIYNLAEKSYRSYKLNEEGLIALLMSYKRAVVVQKDGFFLVDLFAPEAETSFIAAKPLTYFIPHLCNSKSTEILLCSMNDIQLWRFELPDSPFGTTKSPRATKPIASLAYSAHIDGVGYSDVAWYGNSIVAVYNSGSMVHVADTLEGDDDEACDISQPVPVTKLFLDATYLIMGLADGTVRVYGADRLNFISQLNMSPETMHPTRTASVVPGSVYPYKVSYLYRMTDFVISSAVDYESRQLQLSVWALKGSHSVFPLKSKLVVGNVTNVSCDPTQPMLVTVSQTYPEQFVLTRWKLDMKTLSHLLSKWKSTNEANQDALAIEVMREVLSAPGIFKSLMRLPLSSSRVEVVGEALNAALKPNPELLQQLVDTALEHELESFGSIFLDLDGSSSQTNNRQTSPNSARGTSLTRRRNSSETSRGSNLTDRSIGAASSSNFDSDGETSDDSDEGTASSVLVMPESPVSPKMATSPNSVGGGARSSRDYGYPDDHSMGSLDSSSSHHWTMGSLTSSILSNYLVNRCHLYNFVSLSDPLSLLAKSDSKYIFSITSDDSSPEARYMTKRMIKIVKSIIDNLISKEAYLPSRAIHLLAQYHQRLKNLRPELSDLKAMKLGAGRIFITHFVLAAWLEPVKFNISSKVASDLSNMYMVAKLLEIICLGSRNELEGEALSTFKAEQTKRFRTWFIAKLKNPELHQEKEKKRRLSTHVGAELLNNPKAYLHSKSSQKAAQLVRNATLVVTQCIIAHQHELLLDLGAFSEPTISSPKSPSGSISPISHSTDVTVALIKVVSNSLLRPIQTIMNKEGEKDAKLADMLEAFSDSYSSDSARGSNASSDLNRMMTLSFRLDLDAERRSPGLGGASIASPATPTSGAIGSRRSEYLLSVPEIDSLKASRDDMVVDLSEARNGANAVPTPSLISARAVKKRLGVSSRHADIVTLRRRSPRNAAAGSSEISPSPPSSDKISSSVSRASGTKHRHSNHGSATPSSSATAGVGSNHTISGASAPSGGKRRPPIASTSFFENSDPSISPQAHMASKSRSSEFI